VTAGLLLAAGAGTRFGRPKALVEVDGEALLTRGIGTLRAAGCDPVIAVLGAAVPEVVGAQVVVAGDWAEGQGASLRAGLSALAETGATAVVVTLVDQPQLSAEAIRAVLAADGAAVVADYDGTPGHPVVLRRDIWDEVAALAVGDVGARAWLRTHPERVVRVSCSGLGNAVDVDTRSDLARLRG
jgi:CTP:molybdopterin cytidylyltransferase MocA